jgi:predicted phage-related endonuclease
MIKYYNDLIQGTDEWLQCRKGIVTGSGISNLLTPKLNSCKSDKIKDYAMQLIAEQLTEHLEPHFESYDMRRGSMQEEVARQYYTDNYLPVKECGFITNDRFGFMIGCSPDGLVGEDGGIEIKSRLNKFQIETIINFEVPDEYMLQCQFFLLVSERQWIDFIQYSNGMPLFVKRVQKLSNYHDAMVRALLEFNERLEILKFRYLNNANDLITTEYKEFNLDITC